MKKRKWYTKFLAVFLVAITVIGILPMQTFATEYQNYKTLTTVDSDDDSELIIKEELVEERTSNSKTYLLEDGTYCDLIFSNSIHKKDNGKWLDLNNTDAFIDENKSISNVASQLLSATTDDGLVMSDSKVNLNLATIAESLDTDPDYTFIEGISKLNDTSYGIITFDMQSNKNYSKAEATINVNLIMDYYSDNESENNNITIAPLYLDLSNDNITFSDIFENYTDNPTLDFNSVTSEGQAIWNITSEYIKMENGSSTNYNMIIGQEASDDLIVSNAYMQRHYRVIDDNDTGFTYHTIDMGRAGIVYINDYTNTVFVEREELGIPNAILPVSISTFINGHTDYTTYGVGGRINYESKLEYFSNTFVWDMFNGSSIRFHLDSNEGGLEKWVEYSYNPQGYTLWVDADSSRNFIYSNNYIVDESGNKYSFNGDGYIVSITSGNNFNDKLTINYDNHKIDSITDNIGREFVFTYGSFENLRGLSKISINIHDSSANDSQILYDYKNINQKLYLTKATYADGKSVEYNYDSIGRLLSVKNIDNSIIEFNYAVSENTAQKNKNPVYYGRINSYTKKVLDADCYITEYITTINVEYPYRRVFSERHYINGTSESTKSNVNPFDEIIQFNRNLDVLYITDNSGNNIYADYDDNHNLLSLVTPIDEENLIINGEMDRVGNKSSVPTHWNRINISNRPAANESNILQHENDKTDNYAIIYNKLKTKKAFYQDVKIDGKAGDKFVISSWGKGNATIPKENRFWGIKISALNSNGIYEVIHSMAFDTSLWDSEQFRSTAFSLPINTTSLRVELISEDQLGNVSFDKVNLSKADYSYVASVDNAEIKSTCTCDSCEYAFCTCTCETEESCECVSCKIKATTTNDSHGNIAETKTTNGLTELVTKNEYTSNGNYLSKYIDENKVSTSYEYSLTNGLLLSKTLANGSKISYNYDAIGLLTSVSQDVTNVLTGDVVSMNTSYSYENDKIKSITHNGFSYTYDYDIYGNVKSINVGDTKLVSYEYNDDYYNNINKITYANGEEIIYSYDNKDNVIGIKFKGDSEWRYTYTYDEYNQLKSFTDNISNRITTYNKTIDGIKYEEVVETIGENSRIIYGITENNNGEYTQSVFGKDYSIKTETQYDSSTGNTLSKKTAGTVIFGEDGNIENVCTKDAFERITSDYMTMYTNSGNINERTNTSLSLNNEYTYKNASDTQTTKLVETVTSTVYFESESSKEILRRVSLKYDYDDAGRITMISVENDSDGSKNYYPVHLYKYDEAGQITVEWNAFTGMAYAYAYDAGGNITVKKIYENPEFDETNNEFDLGEVTDTITYEYDSVWKDKLISYAGKAINYDALGNPLNYAATTFNNQESDMALEWDGRLLVSATAVDGSNRYEYKYDANGLRTEKTLFENVRISEEQSDGSIKTTDVFVPKMKFEYIWSNETLSGYRITSYDIVTDDNGNNVLDDEGNIVIEVNNDNTFIVNMLYNEDGEALGVNCHSELEGVNKSLTFLFVKDAQGNVVSISALEGGYFFDLSYDSFGNPSLEVTGSEIDKIQQSIADAKTQLEKILLQISGALGIAVVTGITFMCVPTTYRGYMYDMETGLYYCQSRYYSPEWGRFLNADDTSILSLTNEDLTNVNLFSYCNNDPVNNIDPTGYLAKRWYNKVSNVAKAIDIAIIVITAGKSLVGIKAIRTFIKANRNKLLKTVSKEIIKMLGKYSTTFLSAAFNIALTLFGTSIGDLIARGLDYADPLWKKGYIRNNGYILN